MLGYQKASLFFLFYFFLLFQIAVLPQSVYERITLTLIIKNINDNSPVFESSLISVSIPENAEIGQPIEIPDLAAFDPDLQSRDLTYKISKNEKFDITATNGRVFLTPLSKLDRESDAFIGLVGRVENFNDSLK